MNIMLFILLCIRVTSPYWFHGFSLIGKKKVGEIYYIFGHEYQIYFDVRSLLSP